MNDILNEYLKNNKINFSINAFRNYIYIVESDHLYKIGYASNLEGRLTVIKTSSPHEVRLIYLIPIPADAKHKKVENALHKMFKDSHVKGEWFNLSMKDIAKIKSFTLQDILDFADQIEREIFLENQTPKEQLSFFSPEDKLIDHEG